MASIPAASASANEADSIAASAIAAANAGDPSELSGARRIDPLLGSIVDGRYLIERAAGSGGFGDVYRAVHLRFDSPVAIKVLRVASRWRERDRLRFIDLFLAEGKLLFNLGALHSAIVRVFEAGTLCAADGSLAPYFVMEWLDGSSLDAEMRARANAGDARFELGELISLLDSCVQGLAVAHKRGVAHRDIKPGNIFLVHDGDRITTKLLDFGLAKATSETAPSASITSGGAVSEVPFTPAYAAPEQWLQQLGPTGPWTDVYALALVCGELLAGNRALRGQDRKRLMAACLDEAARPTPRSIGAPIPDAVDAVFEQALAIEPRRRYRDVYEFWTALCAASASAGIDLTHNRRVSLYGTTTAGVAHHAALGATAATAELDRSLSTTDRGRPLRASVKQSIRRGVASALFAGVLVSTAATDSASESPNTTPRKRAEVSTVRVAARVTDSATTAAAIDTLAQAEDSVIFASGAGPQAPSTVAVQPNPRHARASGREPARATSRASAQPQANASDLGRAVDVATPKVALDLHTLLSNDALSRRK